MKETFAGKIRQAAKSLCADGNSFTTKALSAHAGLQTRKDEKRMLNALRDFIKAGEARRISTGVYIYLGKQRNGLPLKDQMRNYLKIKKVVTVDDLRELGATESYAMEWLHMLVRRGVVVPLQNARYELVANMVVPENDEKAERLRQLRAAKKAQIAIALDDMSAALGRAIKVLKDL
jgi:hypothetical protein